MLSSLLDSLGTNIDIGMCVCHVSMHLTRCTHTPSTVAAGQALRPFRLGEAAVWRILARVKQRAVGVVAVDGGC